MRMSRQMRSRTRSLGGRQLKLLRPWSGNAVGAVINPPASAAQILMDRGIAEPVEDPVEEPVVEAQPEPETVEEPPKRKRGRPPKNPNPDA